MPMDPGTLTPIFMANLVAVGMIGPSTIQLATGLANGTAIYAQTSIVFQSVDAGTLGAGAGLGVGVIVPPAIIPAMIGSFTGHGILGPFSIPTATGVANGMMLAFATAIIQTVAAGVGLGAGFGFCIPNPGASVGIYTTAFIAAGMAGPSTIQLASAVATGLDAVLPASTAPVAIVGPPNIVPGAGTGIGKLL
jgi:hypothetical protein